MPGVALALLTKGLIAPVFFLGAAIPYLLLTGQWRRWKALKPVTGLLVFLAIAAPWHILCGIINHDQGHPVGNHPTVGNVHGFFYFYFINEHVLRFFNLRYPHDYNKMPGFGTGWGTWCGSSRGACFCPPRWLWHGRRGAVGSSTCATMPATRWTSTWTTPCAKTWPAMCCASSSACAPSGC
jgi:4-amino-4-deoxy-L-arabinose transferase-like glycosyltransferase